VAGAAGRARPHQDHCGCDRAAGRHLHLQGRVVGADAPRSEHAQAHAVRRPVDAREPHPQLAPGVEAHFGGVDSNRGLRGAAEGEKEVGALARQGWVARGVGRTTLRILEQQGQGVDPRPGHGQREEQMSARGLSGAETCLEVGLPPLAEQLAEHGERSGRGVPRVPDVHPHVEELVGDGHHPRHLEARGGGKAPGREQEDGGRARDADA